MQPGRQSDGHAQVGTDGAGDPMVGRLLDGRYRIGARIARGGMASVYEATDMRLDRTVAVKVMHAGLGDDDEFAARFVREARAAARLSHPNVVAVFDQGTDGDAVFLAMELVDGHTLRDVIRKEAPMPPAKALALLEPVLSALAAAHRAGLIHRDVKPENVLIATDPSSGTSRIKVADFGLARAVSAETQHTATGGVLIGTVSYLAPELVVDGRADARADVYAAGVVLYELLTGAKPHEGESPIQVAYKHVHEDVPPPSLLVPGIPAYVDALVARATARDRSQRPADAAVLLHQVHRVSQALGEGVVDDPDLTSDLTPLVTQFRDDTTEVPVEVVEPTTFLQTTPPPPPVPAQKRTTPPPRPRRRRRGLLATILAVLLVAGLGVGAWWFLDGRYTSTPGVLGMTKAAAEAELADAGLEAEWGDRAYSETVPAGRVISTDPEPGAQVVDGGTVTVVLSLGKERYDVPRLRGMTEDEAQDALADTNLAFGTTTESWSDVVPKGEVITSDPKAGTTLKPDTAVDLVISKGPKPVKLKDWVGKPVDNALAWLEAKGLTGKVSDEEYSDTVPEGSVISMDPPAGTTLTRGDEVSFVVSQGPELIEVPSVRAQGVEAATETLQDLGFEVVTEEAPGYLGLGFVFSQSPGGGERVPIGSTITLSII
ncbi:Stk1 family PASTA domain-containing Ser/Thr kinase [Nocardioides caricicola]|uniref:non-specific serine/threonine protein kinase n=1 Tax=Nocardioides caricicola TaxID=634770 RepID=A0ABW0MYB1_9ACTN